MARKPKYPCTMCLANVKFSDEDALRRHLDAHEQKILEICTHAA